MQPVTKQKRFQINSIKIKNPLILYRLSARKALSLLVKNNTKGHAKAQYGIYKYKGRVIIK